MLIKKMLSIFILMNVLGGNYAIAGMTKVQVKNNFVEHRLNALNLIEGVDGIVEPKPVEAEVVYGPLYSEEGSLVKGANEIEVEDEAPKMSFEASEAATVVSNRKSISNVAMVSEPKVKADVHRSEWVPSNDVKGIVDKPLKVIDIESKETAALAVKPVYEAPRKVARGDVWYPEARKPISEVLRSIIDARKGLE